MEVQKNKIEITQRLIRLRWEQSGTSAGWVEGYKDQDDFEEEFLNWVPVELLDECKEYQRLTTGNIEAE